MNKKDNIFYKKTANESARPLTLKFLNMNIKPGKAVDVGCGVGNDTIELIKNGWNVLSIDKNNTSEMILKRLNDEEKAKFSFKVEEFEKIEIPNNDLIVSNFALSFCKEEEFNNLWNKIKNSISLKVFFVGNIFGDKDEWNTKRKDMTFFNKSECLKLFDDNFEILDFNEIEKDGSTAIVENKHWHYFNIIAKKIKV